MKNFVTAKISPQKKVIISRNHTYKEFKNRCENDNNVESMNDFLNCYIKNIDTLYGPNFKETLFMIAAHYKAFNTMKLLIEKGAFIHFSNEDNDCVLDRVMKHLSSGGDKDKEDIDTAIYIIQEIDKLNNVHECYEFYNTKYMHTFYNEKSILSVAVELNSPELLEALIKTFGNDFGNYGYVKNKSLALGFACKKNNTECVEILLKNGFLDHKVIVNYYKENVERFDDISNWVWSNYENSMLFRQYALDKDILNLKDSKGKTPFMNICYFGKKIDNSSFLGGVFLFNQYIDAGAKLNERDVSGNSALEWAAKGKENAKLKERDENGNSALDSAAKGKEYLGNTYAHNIVIQKLSEYITPHPKEKNINVLEYNDFENSMNTPNKKTRIDSSLDSELLGDNSDSTVFETDV